MLLSPNLIEEWYILHLKEPWKPILPYSSFKKSPDHALSFWQISGTPIKVLSHLF